MDGLHQRQVLLLVSLLPCVTPYRFYQIRIPNGDAVPHPCKPGKIWEGVGHYIAHGTGVRNAFGEDFANAGHQWTVDLCRKDSDGDGVTNGQELGDSDCEWKENAIPKRTDSITHPGICDPWDGTECLQRETAHSQYTTQSEWMDAACRSAQFVCDGLKVPDVKNISLRVSRAELTAKVTTYMCQIFDLTMEGMEEGDYHMIAAQPIVDNADVLHHMSLIGCADDVETREPYECGMSPHKSCDGQLHIWTVGMIGECYHPSAGMRIGLNGYTKVAIQFHYNNIEKRSDIVDRSGLILHYTPNRRQYDAGVLTLGSIYFHLPPHQQSVSVESVCSGTCTQSILTDKIYVTSAWNHMHYAGRAMSIELRRNNKLVTHLTYDQVYSYDSPQIHFYSEPVEVLPGDELMTRCHFQTLNKNETIFYGEATDDEMCFGFLTFYPRQNAPEDTCVNQLDYSFCDKDTQKGCSIEGFARGLTNSSMYHDIMAKCQVFAPCVAECKETLLHYMKSEPCMRAESAWEFLQAKFLALSDWGRNFLGRLASCKTEVHLVLNPPQRMGDNEHTGGNSSVRLSHDHHTTMLIGVLALIAAILRY